MFNRMRECLDNFEKNSKKIVLTEEEADYIDYFYLNFANAMLHECPEVSKVARVIVVEHGLFDDVNIKFGK